MSGDPDRPDARNATEGAPRDRGRRRLLQGGLVATPVVMTVASRPVLGQACQTPSAFVSGTISGPHGTTCAGMSAAQWLSASTSVWTAAGFNKNSAMFGGQQGAFENSPYPNGTKLTDVLAFPVNSPPNINDVAREIVAALLNASSNRLGSPPVLTVAMVKDIWKEAVQSLAYSPTPGVSWNFSELLAYLATTHSP